MHHAFFILENSGADIEEIVPIVATRPIGKPVVRWIRLGQDAHIHAPPGRGNKSRKEGGVRNKIWRTDPQAFPSRGECCKKYFARCIVVLVRSRPYDL